MVERTRKIRNTGRLRSNLINRNLLNITLKKSVSIAWDYKKYMSQMALLLRLLGAFSIDVVTVYLNSNALGNFDGEV